MSDTTRYVTLETADGRITFWMADGADTMLVGTSLDAAISVSRQDGFAMRRGLLEAGANVVDHS